MNYSTNAKSFDHFSQNKSFRSDEDQILDLMSCLLDRIDKEQHPSVFTDVYDTLFDVVSPIQRNMSMNSSDPSYKEHTLFPASTNIRLCDNSLKLSNDLFELSDDSKHSVEVLHNDDNSDENKKKKNRTKILYRVPSRKLFDHYFLII